MSFDTQLLNKSRQNLQSYDEIWVFGYGSLIYKVDFDYIERRPANIYGYERRLWQGSNDHRGTIEQPGRVATLVPSANTACFGMAYKVNPTVFEHLDYREKNGYLREEIIVEFTSGPSVGQTVSGLVYIANPENEAYLGKATISKLAMEIYASKGPSGENKCYVYDLAKSLREHGVYDEHILAVERALRVLDSNVS